MPLKRRTFLQTSFAGGLIGATWGTSVLSAADPSQHVSSLRLAPHLGQFHKHAGEDWRAQLDFMAEYGFQGLQENGLMNRSPRFQWELRRELESHSMEMGPFVGVAEYAAVLFGTSYESGRRQLWRRHRQALGVAQRSGASSFIVVPGKRDATVHKSNQLEHAVRFYQEFAVECENAGVNLLLEPIRHCTASALMSTPMFLSSLEETINLCAQVNHPRCRLLFDVYQQHLQLDDFANGLRQAAPWIGHIELGDSHGRKEPGTGEIDFSNLFAALKSHRYDGLLGLEHGTSIPGEAGERALLTAYQQLGLLSTDFISA
ncbi:Hydroxypyruvate isomerase [Polystyrenella longa]|uniref:Hydroxypyruvate isomerase n=1 Tax=Polystyrenella longa TaxID=2528007 RepID=A0A518CS55_9PLAN|nr:TIM barrel protein [Polystyrenella longa]QDU82071.1 Hydroxypyruvate isomerase [Polystyrenella longa]